MWDWLYPRLCTSCEAPLLASERHVCMRCFLRLPQTLFWRYPQSNEAYYRLRPHFPIAGALAGFWYTVGSPLRPIIQAAKYEGRPQAAYGVSHAWGKLLQAEAPQVIAGIEALLPIPLSRARLRQRGYNQAAWIAKGLAEALGKPLLLHSWKRTRATQSQVQKGKLARWQSLDGAFVVTGSLPSVIGVVDDVLTTGATLRAALQSLPPNLSVWVLTLGITQRRT